jgi:glycosyltransferase involved in cell wall biosynthesis
MANSNVSVAMATYNGNKFIIEQLDSIINQTLKPDEIIVSDDHSSEKTYNILKSYSDKGLIKLHINPDKGVVSNFKNAVSNCTKGNYIALADQDDIWLADKLKVDYNALQIIDNGTAPALVFSDLTVVDENNHLLNQSFFNEIVKADPSHEKLQSLLFSNKVIGCTTMFNQAMRVMFDEMPINNVCMHDYWIALIGFTFGAHNYIPQPVIRYRRHANNVTDAGNSFVKKVKKELSDYIFNKRIQLDEHIEAAETFFTIYKDRLDNDQRKILQQFIKLKKSTTIIKRLNSFYHTR